MTIAHWIPSRPSAARCRDLRRAIPLKILTALLVFCLFAPLQIVGAADRGAPPRFEVPASTEGSLTFVVYGDTRFTKRNDVANAFARRALVDKIAHEKPLAIFIGGDVVYEGSNTDDYVTYQSETKEWSSQKIAVFPALGNHEFSGCTDDQNPCLENWWKAAGPLVLRPYRWYSVTIGSALLALILDSDAALKPGSPQRVWFERQITDADNRIKFILVVLHYPPMRDPFYPTVRDEKEVSRYLSNVAKSLRAQVVVVGSHVHNYERYYRDGVTYLVSGGGGAKPVPAIRMFGELSKLPTGVNFHYIRFTLQNDRLSGTMVRFDAADRTGDRWTEPDRFEIRARN
jgi:calcineurin-like phosphoesterase family protein